MGGTGASAETALIPEYAERAPVTDEKGVQDVTRRRLESSAGDKGRVYENAPDSLTREAKIDEIIVESVLGGIIDCIVCLDLSSGKARFVRKPLTKEAFPEISSEKYRDFDEVIRTAAAFMPSTTLLTLSQLL